MKKRKIIGLVLATVLSLGVPFVSFSAPEVVSAAEEQLPDYRLGVSPSYSDMGDLKPGQSGDGEFKIKNMGLKDFDYQITFAPYTVQNDRYDPNFTIENQYTEIRKWITVDKPEGSLGAGKDEEIHYTVEVPDGQHGGSQAGAILITIKNNNQDNGNIEAVRQLAYIVYANIDGQVTRTGKVLENKVPSFLFNPPISVSTLVENTGNVYTRATYKLQVFPLFSDEEVYTNEETPENNIIFPETKRYNELKWEGAPQLGIFKVRSTVKIFDEENVVEKMVFLCPIWFLFLVILIIFLIIFWIVSRIIRRKKEA